MWATVSTDGGNWLPDTRYGLGVHEETLPGGLVLRGGGGGDAGSFTYVRGTPDAGHLVAIHTNNDWCAFGVFAEILEAEFDRNEEGTQIGHGGARRAEAAIHDPDLTLEHECARRSRPPAGVIHPFPSHRGTSPLLRRDRDFGTSTARRAGSSTSTTWTAVLGYEEGELTGDADFWLMLVHPDDYERVNQADQDHQAGKTPHFEMEYRIRHKTGRWLWVLDRGKIIEREEDGAIVRAIGTLTDITRRKFVEEDLSRTAALLSVEKERLRVTLNSIGDAVICTNSNGRISFMNPIAEKMTRVPASDGIGQRLRDVYLAVDEQPAGRSTTSRPMTRRRNRHGIA